MTDVFLSYLRNNYLAQNVTITDLALSFPNFEVPVF